MAIKPRTTTISPPSTRWSRRGLLSGFAASAAGGILAAPWLSRVRDANADDNGRKPRFLVIIGGYGGASIVDSFLAIRNDECDDWRTLNTFAPSEVLEIEGSPFRAVDISRDLIGGFQAGFRSEQAAFAAKHHEHMMVATVTGTSVTHSTAQRRALTGNGAWGGRTLQELTALEYGRGLLLPNVNAATDGFAADGDDPGLPSNVYAELLGDPGTWSLGLHGHRGIVGAPPRELITASRRAREQVLERDSVFYRTFEHSPQLRDWVSLRERMAEVEDEDYISRLALYRDTERFPLAEFGITPAEDADRLAATFPQLEADPLEAQAALAFLLLKNRVSVSVTIAPGPGFVYDPQNPAGALNLSTAFDNSHQDHRASQGFMWNRILRVTDRLIELLRAEPFEDSGETLWDRTLIYVATEFGRSRTRAAEAELFSSAHHLNNGVLLLSPMLRGNTVLGGVDPATTMTYGWDPTTGDPDPGRETTEAELFAGLLDVLEVSTEGSGLPRVTAMSRA